MHRRCRHDIPIRSLRLGALDRSCIWKDEGANRNRLFAWHGGDLASDPATGNVAETQIFSAESCVLH